MTFELYQLPWHEVPLRKYEGEEVPVGFFVVVPELVILDEDENTRAQCDPSSCSNCKI